MTTKRCYVTSDLHIADGGTLDDFVDDAAFATWIDSIAGPDTTLVLNGDIVDFALIPPWTPPKDLPSHLLWTEADSVLKLDRCMAAHAEFFDALGRLHAAGGTIVVIVGNHDLDWIWPAVQLQLAKRLAVAEIPDAGFERLLFEPIGWSFADVWIEHGHRFTAENAPKDADDPASWIHTHADGTEYLERVWGTDFLMSFFNDKHDEYPYLPNIKPTFQVAVQGLKRGWFGWKDFVRMTAFLARRGLPLDGIVGATLSTDDPGASIDATRLLNLFDDKEIRDAISAAVRELDRTALTKGPLDNLDDDLLRSLKAAAAVDISHDDFGFGSLHVPDDLDPDGSSPTMGLFRESREVRAAEAALHEHRHVVYGHTHVVVDGHEVRAGKRIFNPGCWIPHLDLANPRVKKVIDDTGLTAGVLNNRSGPDDPDGEGYYTREFYAIEILDDGSTPELMFISNGSV